MVYSITRRSSRSRRHSDCHRVCRSGTSWRPSSWSSTRSSTSSDVESDCGARTSCDASIQRDFVAHTWTERSRRPKVYGRRVKILRVASMAIVLTLLGGAVAQATPKLVRTTPPFVGGFYSEQGGAKGVASIEFFVSGNGREIIGGHRSSGDCFASAALVATGVQQDGPISFYFPRSIPISPSGSFSATETVTMTPEDTQSAVGGSGTFTISGHFIKGKIVSYRTNAVVGTFSAPDLCAPNTPKRVVMQWDINDL